MKFFTFSISEKSSSSPLDLKIKKNIKKNTERLIQQKKGRSKKNIYIKKLFYKTRCSYLLLFVAKSVCKRETKQTVCITRLQTLDQYPYLHHRCLSLSLPLSKAE